VGFEELCLSIPACHPSPIARRPPSVACRLNSLCFVRAQPTSLAQGDEGDTADTMNPVTPMRNIPGAYFNTPAPGANTAVRRRLNFNSDVGDKTHKGGLNTGAPPVSETAIMSTTGPQPKPPKEEISPVEKAAQTVNRTLQQDESYPDLDSYCRREYLPRVWARPCVTEARDADRVLAQLAHPPSMNYSTPTLRRPPSKRSTCTRSPIRYLSG